MGPESGVFEAFYASFAQHPLGLWLAAGVGIAATALRRDLQPSLRAYGLVLGVVSLADAWLTTRPVPGLGELPGAAASAVPLGFVLAGDYRYLLLLLAATPGGAFAPGLRSALQAAALTAIVPVASQLAVWALPAGLPAPRTLFLVYELAFVALVAALLRWHPKSRLPWLRRVSRFVMLYYALWAAADVVILAGFDFGFALRVVPNLLYYGGLIAAIAWLAPPRAPASA